MKHPSFKRKILSVLLATLSLVLALPAAGAAQGAAQVKFKAGFAEREITPRIGMEEPGGYGKVFHTKLHDPCKVRAAVFDDGNLRVALIGIDALMISRQLVQAARAEINAACGIRPEAILMGASHSHSSGPTGMIQPGEYDHGSDLVKKLAYEQSSCADAEYLKLVQSRIVDAVVSADRAKEEAHCGVGRGIEDKVGFNRRLRMRHGQSWSHPGKGNPDIVGYAGPIDPEVGVIGAWDKNGKLLGSIVNFACHATTNPGGISANWIYYLEKAIQGGMLSTAPVVFLQGACGDITQVDNLSLAANPTPEKWAHFVGGRVGAEAVKVLLSIVPGPGFHLDAKSIRLNIPRRPPGPERLRQALATVQNPAVTVHSAEWVFAKELVLLDALMQKEPVVPVEVQAIQVGPAVLIANPAEYFVEFGLELKRLSPFPFTFPVELANGCVGYVPTTEAFSPRGGGYETRLTSYSNLEITAGDQILQAGVRLAREMTPDPEPQAPRAAPYKQPWSYGNVPPELE